MPTFSPIVSARQVVATPITPGWYWRVTLARPARRLSRPPKMVAFSEKFDEAMSIGSLKWLIM